MPADAQGQVTRSPIREQAADQSPLFGGGPVMHVISTTMVSVQRQTNEETAEESVCLAFAQPSYVVFVNFHSAKQLRSLIGELQTALKEFHAGDDDGS